MLGLVIQAKEGSRALRASMGIPMGAGGEASQAQVKPEGYNNRQRER